MNYPVTVSVVIPLYNAVEVIGETIDSVLAQTWTDKEILVIDDGSTDGSGDIVKSYGDHVHYHCFPNSGPAVARNRGIALAHGRYIAFLDSDDLWAPSKLDRQIQAMENCPEIGLVLTDVVHLDWFGRPTGIVAKGFNPTDDFSRLFLKGFAPTPSNAMVRTEILKRSGGFDERFGPIGGFEDYDFWARIANFSEIESIPQPLTFHRDHENSSDRNRLAVVHRGQMVDFLLERFGHELERRRYLLTEKAAYLADEGKWRVRAGDLARGRACLKIALSLSLREAWSWKCACRALGRLVRSYFHSL